MEVDEFARSLLVFAIECVQMSIEKDDLEYALDAHSALRVLRRHNAEVGAALSLTLAGIELDGLAGNTSAAERKNVLEDVADRLSSIKEAYIDLQA